MFRAVLSLTARSRAAAATRAAGQIRAGGGGGARQHPAAVLASRWYSHGKQETDEEFDARWVTYFNKPDIDAWELRKGMNTLIGYDLVPEPKILDAALRACRRLNDLASAIRILEAVKSAARLRNTDLTVQELGAILQLTGFSKQSRLCINVTASTCQDKAGHHKDIYPYVIQELRPTLTELGIPTPEEIGLDKL